MKKIFLFICIIFSLSLYSQRTGISYQALILDPNGEQLPGYNNENAPLTNTAICLEFIIRDDRNVIEYSEYQSVTTDKYGMVNLIIGTGDYAGGYSGGWDGIVWSEKSKKLIVKLDTSASCSDFIEISNQELTSVAFALYAPGQDGRDGESAYEIWLSEGNVGTVQQFLDSLKGEKGDDGLSAFEIWIDLGNSETEQDFIDSLKGEDGEAGKSAYQIWLDAGNTGTEEDFLDSLKGSNGNDGDSGNQSLIKTTVEAAGDNCANGGIKIESGIDSNADGTLDDDEVDSSQTKYLCNGTDGADGKDGVDGVDGADGADGSGNANFEICNEFELVAAFTTEVSSSGISHQDDPSIEYSYPGASQGNANQYFDGSNLNFTNLGSSKIVITAANNGNLPHNRYTIRGYDSSGQELTISVKKEEMYWVTTSFGDYRGKMGGGYQFNANANNQSEAQVFYYSSVKGYTDVMGAQYYGRGGGLGGGNWNVNLEITSNTKIDRITLNYDETFSAGTSANIVTAVLKYKCATVSSSSTNTTPPADLALGDYFGGGIVFYIAQSGDPIHVEGEIHGLIAPINWRSNVVSGTSGSTWRWNQYPSPQKDMYQTFTSSMFNIGGGETLTNKIATTYINERPDQYSEENHLLSKNNYSNPWVNAYHSKLNGYEDWFIPNNLEVSKLRQYMGVTTGSSSSKNNNILASSFVADVYLDSGYWRAGSYNYAVSPNCQAWNNSAGQCYDAVYYMIRAF